MEKNKPVYEKRLGSIRLAIWRNTAEEGKNWHNVAITRRYRHQDEWKEATTFNGLGDLALVGECVNAAKAWIAEDDKQA